MKCQVLVVTLCLSFQWMGYAEGQVISPQNSSLLQQPQYSSSFSSDKDVGHWSVENCILAKFGMNFTLRPDLKNRNKTRAVKVSPQAIADNDKGFCGNTTQELRLHWYDPETNSTENLFRNITIVFGRADNAT